MTAPDEMTYEEWLTWVFDHPVTKPEWYWQTEGDRTELSPSVAMGYLTSLFERCDGYLSEYSDAQVNQGLFFLVSPSCSNYMFALTDRAIPWPEQQRAIQSINRLYDRCFAARCSPHLMHLDESGASPLNNVCYMWWDLFPTHGHPEVAEYSEVDAELINVMVRALTLNSDACIESALHGLGHWQRQYPREVYEAIDSFLARSSDLRAELITYAEYARDGLVQ